MQSGNVPWLLLGVGAALTVGLTVFFVLVVRKGDR